MRTAALAWGQWTRVADSVRGRPAMVQEMPAVRVDVTGRVLAMVPVEMLRSALRVLVRLVSSCFVIDQIAPRDGLHLIAETQSRCREGRSSRWQAGRG